MSRKIFVNVPVRDLQASIRFYEQLGFTVNPTFTDETAACLVISEEIYAMLLTHARFKDFTPKAICDAKQQTEVLLGLSCENRTEVDRLADLALSAGAESTKDPMDMGFMYLRSIQDLDGHIWELFWMDPTAEPPRGVEH